MKKILLFAVALMSATMMQAGLGLTVGLQAISSDTEITVTEVEIDEFTGDAVMEWNGKMSPSPKDGSAIVYIEREHACVEGYEDQFCAGSCITGTAGQLRDTMNVDFKLASAPEVYAHYYPQSSSVETIKYHFVGCGDDFTLTVKYDASAMAVEQVVDTKKSVKVIRNGQVIIIRDGVEYNALGAKL